MAEVAMPSGPPDSADNLATADLLLDEAGAIDVLCTTRSIRRYLDEPIPADILRTILFAATRAPSGSNRQPFRMLVLTNGPKALKAKKLIGDAARSAWEAKRRDDGYDIGSGQDPNSPKARAARAMQRFVDEFESCPALVLPCLVRYRDANLFEGASVFPACQNILLAARALGYGGVMTGWHAGIEDQLCEVLGIPDGVAIAGTITLGKPEGSHGPVRRRPMSELVFEESWGQSASFAVDPPGTAFTAAGPGRPTHQ